MKYIARTGGWFIVMVAGESYHIRPGTVHQVTALTDCVFFEASTPHFDDRERLAL